MSATSTHPRIIISEVRRQTVLRAIFARIAARLERDDDRGDETEFVPSQLDASVLFAHGKGNEAERTVTDVEEQAQRLEEQRRNRGW